MNTKFYILTVYPKWHKDLCPNVNRFHWLRMVQAAGDSGNGWCGNTVHPAPDSPLPYLVSLNSSYTQKVEDIDKKAIIASW